MIIPTEPIGSMPRTPELLAAFSQDALDNATVYGTHKVSAILKDRA